MYFYTSLIILHAWVMTLIADCRSKLTN
jgi:hypothetical protein